MTDVILTNHKLEFNGNAYDCAVGKCGLKHDKCEGDNCTPIGEFALREVLYRADKLEKPQTKLAISIIGKNDAWCDAPQDKNYNRKVKLPYQAGHEKLWRDDDIYDVVVPLGYNDKPVIPGKGSAIFLHVARSDYSGTEGCVALKLPDLLEMLRGADENTRIIIKPIPCARAG